MIQKIIFSVLFTLSVYQNNVSAQCIPDSTLKGSGYKPDTLEHGKTWEPYTQTITVRTPKDTMVNFNGNIISVTVDSIVATGILGLPPGYSYTCDKPGCAFVWQEPRCINIAGSTGQAGIYFLKIPVVAYAKWGNIPLNRPDTITRFNLVVNGTGSVFRIERNNSNELNMYPNPAKTEVFIYHNTGVPLEELIMYDLFGRKMNIKPDYLPGGCRLNTTDMTPGVYFVMSGAWKGRLEIVE